MRMTITGNSAGGGQTSTNVDATGSSASSRQVNANIRGTVSDIVQILVVSAQSIVSLTYLDGYQTRQIEVNDPPSGRSDGHVMVTSEGAGRVGTGVGPSVGSGRREPHHTGTNIGRDGPSVNPLNPNVVRPVPPPPPSVSLQRPPVPQRVQYNTVTVGRHAGSEETPASHSSDSTFQRIVPSSSTDPIQVMNSGHVSTGNDSNDETISTGVATPSSHGSSDHLTCHNSGPLGSILVMMFLTDVDGEHAGGYVFSVGVNRYCKDYVGDQVYMVGASRWVVV
ncbi:hypothetical protein EV360DRAFT_82084 [Lentinula raphanica]|nr:hypothetical protein EV360DRAFT_82084 [Lentinula raphanica]